MLNYNFIKVSAFALIVLLFFSVSVYDPLVYAKMQVMEDDHLAQIEGEAGVTIGLNLTVRSAAYNIILSNGTSTGMNDSINFGTVGAATNNVFIGDGDDQTQPFSVSTNVISDVGTSGGRTWLYTSGISLPSSANGMGIMINNLSATIDGTTRALGSLAIAGIYMGRDVTSVTPNLTGTSSMTTRMGAHSSGTGIELYQSSATYIDSLYWAVGTGGSYFNLSGIYMYGEHTDNVPAITGAGAIRSGWGALTGNQRIGNNGTSDDLATVDVGTSSGVNGTILRLSVPNSGDMRIGNIIINGNDFGPMVQDGQHVYRMNITIRNLNASGY